MPPERRRDLGLLLLRAGMGLMFVVHGWPKIKGGPDTWEKLGGAVGALGIDLGPDVMWGFCAATSEFAGGILVALGLLFRPATAALVATMVVAAAMHLGKGDGLAGASHAIEAAVVFAGLFLTGPGRYSVNLRTGR